MVGNFFTVRGIPRAVKQEFKVACLKKRETIGTAISDLMIQYISESGYDTDLWEGFSRVPWSRVRPGEKVWLAHYEGGAPVALGPHTVIDSEARRLCNPTGTGFWNHKETLLKKVR